MKESTPSIASDFNIPKVFEEAFFDVSQVEKVRPCQMPFNVDPTTRCTPSESTAFRQTSSLPRHGPGYFLCSRNLRWHDKISNCIPSIRSLKVRNGHSIGMDTVILQSSISTLLMWSSTSGVQFMLRQFPGVRDGLRTLSHWRGCHLRTRRC